VHAITICRVCEKIIQRCRCMGPHAVVMDLCDLCRSKTMEELVFTAPKPTKEPSV
jgi:hypothetical protein